MINLSKKTSRRGIALVAALVALAGTTAILVGILRAASDVYRHVHAHQRQLQANRLVDAGIGRALARLHDSADYRGETWRISAEELGGKDSAEISIRVTQDVNDPNMLLVAVQAVYPQTEFHRARQSREVTVHLP